MSFATAFALLIGALIAAPLVAHLLRRRKVQLRDFPAARLVMAAQPVARQRARLEDRALFAVRALAVLALALLGASPFVSCSRLSLGREGGGSVAVVLVVDDSLSMQARLGARTRLDRAREGAHELVRSLREGDVVALVAAGAPPRLLLATTSDLGAAQAALDDLHPSERATDLDGALALGASLARSLPHPSRRVVLFSDLADGSGSSQPVGASLDVPLWIPLSELAARVPDCAVLRAVRKGAQISVDVVCGQPPDATGRLLEVVAGDRVLARAPLEELAQQQLVLSLSDPGSGSLLARLSGSDALAADDVVPVTSAAAALQVGVVSDLTESALVTGGPSPLEQALGALDETLALRPLPIVPDDPETLSPFALVALDDPPGLTPEARAAFRTWLERGGVGLLFLGPRAGGAMLGSSFEPFFPGPVRWSTTAPAGADRASLTSLGATAEGLLALAPRGRALLDSHAFDGATVTGRWSDGAPLLLRRSLGRGEASIVTLPTSADLSDLPLRPAFLELLSDALVVARTRQAGKRSPVGLPWTFQAAVPTEIQGPAGPVALRDLGGARSLVPDRAGLYGLRFGEQLELRVAEIDPREVDTSPRPPNAPEPDGALGSQRAPLDVSSYVAFVLLLVLTAEAGLRLWTRSRERAPA